MKPREFDELFRQKFDQNDFEYNPQNWNKLAEQLDGGRAKKRTLLAWWWMPVAGVAASVAMAMGVTTMLRHTQAGNAGAKEIAANHPQKSILTTATSSSSTEISTAALTANETMADDATPAPMHTRAAKQIHAKKTKQVKDNINWFAIKLHNNSTESSHHIKHDGLINFAAAGDIKEELAAKPKKKIILEEQAIATFKPEAAIAKSPKISIILSGGYNQGNKTSGYMAGATLRRMINDRVYVESDIAFASSDNVQKTQYLASETTITTLSSKTGMAAKSSSSTELTAPITTTNTQSVVKVKDVAYSLYYAQVTPTIGYRLMDKLSIGAGPDFQKMLVDNRPAQSTVDRGTLQEAPLFDVGFVGKTEYAVTKKVRAAVCYRKGINNIITPTDKYIDRDYLQFQLKYTIFNK